MLLNPTSVAGTSSKFSNDVPAYGSSGIVCAWRRQAQLLSFCDFSARLRRHGMLLCRPEKRKRYFTVNKRK